MPLTEWYSRRRGELHGRVEFPEGFNPPEGTHVLVLGADTDNWEIRGRPDDFITEWRQGPASNGGAKLYRYRGRARGPNIPLPAVTGEVTAPFKLADGQTLQVSVDEGPTQTVTFNLADFVDITQATEFEVAAVLRAQLTGVEVETPAGFVAIHSLSTGPRKGVNILGGTASALNFRELVWKAGFGQFSRPFPVVSGEQIELTDQANVLDGSVPGSTFVTLELALGYRNLWLPTDRAEDNLFWAEVSQTGKVLFSGINVQSWEAQGAVNADLGVPPGPANQDPLLGQAAGVNGKRTVTFFTSAGFGAADFLDFPLDVPFEQPFTVYMHANSLDAGASVFFDEVGGGPCQFGVTAGNQWFLNAGASIVGGARSFGFKAFCLIFDGANSAIYANNFATPVASGNAGGNGISGAFRFGTDAAENFGGSKALLNIAIFKGADDEGARRQMGQFLEARYPAIPVLFP